MIYQGVDLALLQNHEVLFFIRIRGKKSYFKNVYGTKFLDLFESVDRYRCISEYTKDADIYIDLDHGVRDYLTQEEHKILLEMVNINDLIMRCRGLRSIPYHAAEKLINRAFQFFHNFYTTHKELKLIVSGTIDNYVLDLMHRVGYFFGVKFIGVTGSFMSPEYVLITTRGEASHFSMPKEEEVGSLYHRLKHVMASPLLPKKRKAIVNACYDLSSYYFRYFVRYLFYYKLQGKRAYEYRFARFMGKFNSFDKLFAVRYLKSEKTLELESSKKYAYIPLHYFPEATIDYWITDPYHVNYEASVLDTIDKLRADGFCIIVKEHPAFYLARSSLFYKQIKERGSQLISPFILTTKILAKIDLVVVWNGSTGIEALVNGKPVVKVANSYYGDGLVPNLDQATKLPKPTEEIGLNVIQKVLESSFRTI